MKRAEVRREDTISVTPITTTQPGRSKKALDLQLRMVTSSINHEYARREFDKTKDIAKREELTEYMADCRAEYFEARKDLEKIDPYAIVEFEADLIQQKLRMIEGLPN